MLKITKIISDEDKAFIFENYAKRGLNYCYHGLNGRVSYVRLKTFCAENDLKKTPLNSEFRLEDFKKVESPNMAYFLGLLWADGHVTFKGGINGLVKLHVVEEDGIEFLSFIEQFGNFTVDSYRPHNRKKRMMGMRIARKDITEYLLSMDYGNKSKNSPKKILKTIPDHLVRYFWLGFFDGDGCIHIGKKTTELSFAGHYGQNWEDLSNFIKSFGGRPVIKFYENKTLGHKSSTIRINAIGDILKFFECCYATFDYDRIGLSRKRLKFLKLIESSEAFLDRSKKRRDLYQGFLNIQTAKDSPNRPYCYCFNLKGLKFKSRGFTSLEDAAIARDAHLLSIKGENVTLNFDRSHYLILDTSTPLE